MLCSRLGYQHTIIERTKFLRLLYDKLDYKERILLGKRVTSVEQLADEVVVKCADGTEYRDDIVVSADGFHSRVREEMRRCAEENGEGDLVKKDRASKSSLESFLYSINELRFSLRHNSRI